MSDSITGEVFLDPSADGAVADGGGAGIGPGTAAGQAGVTVELIAPASGAILSTTTTAADGTYSFDSLADGDYQVLFVAPTGFAFSPTDGGSDSVANTKTGLSSVFTLSSSGNTTQFNEDAGLMPLAGITGQVFLDSVGTGSLAGATGAGANVLGASVTVNLLQNGSVIATTTTDANGKYGFTGLTAGTYQVQFVAPSGDTFSPTGGDSASLADQTTGNTANLTVNPGQVLTNVDAGLLPAGVVSGEVFLDRNGTGSLAGAPGLGGVTVELEDSAGNILATTTTDATGLYSFNAQAAGTDQIQVVAPTGYAFSPTGGGSASLADPTTGTTPQFFLSTGQFNENVGLTFAPGTITGEFFLDENGSGSVTGAHGIGGAIVELLQNGNTIASTTTDSSGFYSFANPGAGTYEVKFIQPNFQQFGTAAPGALLFNLPWSPTGGSSASSANTATGVTPDFTLAAGQSQANEDAGMEGLNTSLLVDYATAGDGSAGINDIGTTFDAYHVAAFAAAQDNAGVWTLSSSNYGGSLFDTTGTGGGAVASVLLTTYNPVYAPSVIEFQYTDRDGSTVPPFGGLILGWNSDGILVDQINRFAPINQALGTYAGSLATHYIWFSSQDLARAANGGSGPSFPATFGTSGPLPDLTPQVCFLPGAGILTPDGEALVENLRVGDHVVLATGGTEPIVWIGVGKVLATRGSRSDATPVIIRKGAFAENVPSQDLRVTKGHAFFLDGALIPVEFLINHRSILWDDRAQEVQVYHVELATHGVLLANGAPAESYRDDGNRWLFHNSNPSWMQPAKPAYVPVMTGGPVVDAVWRRLLDRAGPRPGLPLTDDPDLHLIADGIRVNASEHHGSAYVFPLPANAACVRIVSRASAPDELGLARDPRILGVAVQRIVVRQGTRFRVTKADSSLLSDGFHAFERENGIRWTDGDALLPAVLPAGFSGSVELVLHLGATTQYVDMGGVSRAA